MIEIGTSYVLPDEPCFNLSELDLLSPTGERRRYRVYMVVRGDKLAKHQEDMGPAKSFKTDQVRVLGGFIDEDSKRIYIEHTVNELRGIVEQLRVRQWFDKRELVGLDRIYSNGN